MKTKLAILAACLLASGCTITKLPGLMSRYNFGTKQMVGKITFTVAPGGVTNIVVESYNSDVSAEIGNITSKVAEGVVNGMKSSGS